MKTVDDAKNDLVAVVDGVSWRLSDGALAVLGMLEVSGPPPSVGITRDQQIAVVRAMAAEAEAEIMEGATANRLRATFDGQGRPLDPEMEARAGEVALAIIYRTIAEGGRAASLPEDLKASLAESVGENVCAYVERQVKHLARQEDLEGDHWILGPPRFAYEQALRAAGCEPSLDTIRLIRRDYLLVCAALLEDGARWSKRRVADEVLETFEIAKTAPPPNDRMVDNTAKPTTSAPADASYRATLLRQAVPQAPVRLAPKSLTQHVEDLIKIKKRPVDKHGVEIPGSKGWDIKTANQHRSISRMLVKLAGTDDPRRMDQTLLGAYRLLLNDLPKTWGKSPADITSSIDEIMARSQDLEEHEVGLAGGTIDRHMTQLSNIVSHLADNGVKIGEIKKSMRVGGDGQARGVFTLDELKTLFMSSVWTGCAGVADRLVPGDRIIRDALYWIPILARYELLRLSELTGLMIDDIDFDHPAILVRDNAERRLKTAGATRRQPLVPEILRLGFLAYARRMHDEGHQLLFPCLRSRGEKTPLSNLFYKEFRKILAHVLPHAAEGRKSFHSLRKDGNTQMANANINDPVRHAVMGHAHAGVNEKHYLDSIFDAAKLKALACVPIATSHIASSS